MPWLLPSRQSVSQPDTLLALIEAAPAHEVPAVVLSGQLLMLKTVTSIQVYYTFERIGSKLEVMGIYEFRPSPFRVCQTSHVTGHCLPYRFANPASLNGATSWVFLNSPENIQHVCANNVKNYTRRYLPVR